MCKQADKKLPDLLRYVPDGYKTQQIFGKAIIENGEILKSVPDYYKSNEMSNKAVDNYSHALESVSECFTT